MITGEITEVGVDPENQEKPLPNVQSPPKIGKDQSLSDYYASLRKESDRAGEKAKKLAALDSDTLEIPTARIGKISKNREVVIEFTKEIEFPSEILRKLQDSQTSSSETNNNLDQQTQEAQ